MAYYFEEAASHEGQSDARAFSSVLDALYWAIMTLTVRAACPWPAWQPSGHARAFAFHSIVRLAVHAGIIHRSGGLWRCARASAHGRGGLARP